MPWTRFLRRARWDEERRRELESYLAIEIEELIARGVPAADARARALRKLGNPTRVREEIYDMNSLRAIETLFKDLRHGVRLLRLNPGFAAVALLLLALGIGANTAIFQLLDAVRLRALPVTRPDELAEVRVVAEGGRTGAFLGRRPVVNNPIWERVRDAQQSFSDVAAWGTTRLDLATGGESRPAEVVWASGGFFRVLDVRPALGRVFGDGDDTRGCATPSVVVSHAFWQREFGGAPDVVGRLIRLGGYPMAVVGVTPSSFFGVEVGRVFDVVVPICAQPLLRPEQAALDRADFWWIAILGRLKPGATLESATAELTGRSAAWFGETVPPGYVPEDAEGYRTFTLEAVAAGTGVTGLRGQYGNSLNLLLTLAGLVLLVACANLASLMLARANARQKEIAVRLAIGASRGRVLRQLLSESLLLAALGALAGLWVARALGRALIAALRTDGTPLILPLAIDWRIVGFTTALAVATCAIFGLVPAVRATRTSPGLVMRASGRGLTDGRERLALRRALVAGQIALSVVLVATALLFARSLGNLASAERGFDTDGVLRVQFDLRAVGADAGQLLPLQRRVLDAMRALPGVAIAASADIVPLSGSSWNGSVMLDGVRQKTFVNLNRISASYFAALQIPLQAGRDFDDDDRLEAPRVAIVNQTFVDTYLAGGQAVGRRFKLDVGPTSANPDYEIVGVAADSKYRELRETFTPLAYFPAAQEDEPIPYQQLLVRAPGAEDALRAAVTRAAGEVHPGILLTFENLESQVRETLARERLMAALSGGFGVLALLLASVGLYGLMSYSVLRRQSEIGIRIALGATRRRIVAMIARETTVLVVAGLVIGLGLAVAAARWTTSLLFGLTPADPPTLAAAALALAVAAGASVCLPAVRAARLQPVKALREE
jgi:predicted permease